MAKAAEGSVDNVCDFLNKRGLEEDVVAKFRSEKMDVEAVSNATDDVLEKLGLMKTGDRVSLRAFCQTISVGEREVKSSDNKKRNLLEAFLSRKKKRRQSSKEVPTTHSDTKVEKEKTRKIQLGWLHYNGKTGKFQSVRLLKGGGSREVDMPVEARKDEIIAECIRLFFPNGSSKCLGEASKMDFGLANFKTEAIEDTVHVDESEIPFTLLNYVEAHKTCKIRLYLTSRCKSFPGNEVTQSDKSTTQQHDRSECSTVKGVQKQGNGTCSSGDEEDLKPMLVVEDEVEQTGHVTLIGSSEQRDIIKAEQDSAYFASLANDRATEEARKEAIEREMMEWQRKKSLQQMRALRVLEEPNSPCIMVQVRHPTMGLLRRGFSPSDTMMAVYDWVGSHAPDPEYFELHSSSVKCLPPSISVVEVDRETLYVAECEVPPSINDDADDATVEFRGFGQLLNCSATTVENLGIECIVEQLPENFMVDDSSSGDDAIADCCIVNSHQNEAERKLSVGSYARGRKFREMVNNGMLECRDHLTGLQSQFVEVCQESDEDKRNNHFDDENALRTPSEVPQLENDQHEYLNEDVSVNVANESTSSNMRILRIRRVRVYRDMIEAFQEENIMSTTLKIVMVDGRGEEEQGVDVGGVYRDAVALFWQEFNDSSTLGERERVPTLRHDFQSSEWSAIGRILAKGYLDLGYFPCMLSQAFIVSVLFGENAVPEQTLLKSFQKYIAKDEEEIVAEALKGNLDDTELIDVLDRFGCRKVPTQENAKDLILEVAHKEMVQKPQYVADAWREALVMLKRKLELSTIEGLRNMYQELEPTNKKVLNMLQATPKNNAERASLDYLKRFVRGMDQGQLKSFLRYVTGADVLCVPSIIVQFTTVDGLARRPIAHTCGALLELPATYDSFPELREEFSNILAKTKWQNDIM